MHEGHTSNRKKTVDQWCMSTVKRILKNETYAVTGHYAKRDLKRYEVGRQVRYKYSSHDKDHQIAIEVPAIVGRTIWDAAQQVMKKYGRGGRHPKQEYRLSGILRGIKSHANMHGQTAVRKKATYGYYVCPHRGPALRLDKATRCDVPHLRKHEIKNWVWASIMKLAEQHEQTEAEMTKRREEAEKEQHLTLQAMTGLEKEITRYGSQKAELLDILSEPRQRRQANHA